MWTSGRRELRRIASIAIGGVASAFAVIALTAGGMASSARALRGRVAGVAPVCPTPKLALTFKLVPFSQGAGHVVYNLTATNRSGATCALTTAKLKLFGKTGAPLPSHPHGNSPPFTVAPGAAGIAEIQFSPDIAALHEHQSFPCEPVAYTVELTLAGSAGSAKGKVKPPTPVCQYGNMGVNAWKASQPPGA
jgi:hypothetical protein